MKYKVGQVAVFLGVILVIMGLATSNIVEGVLGIMLLALGIYDYVQKGRNGQEPPNN